MGEQQEAWSSAAFSFQTHIRPLTGYEWESSRRHGHQEDSHFKSTSDHLQAMNGRAAGGMVISRILISNLHQTTYCLDIGEQQESWSSAGFSVQIHIRPLTSYEWESSRRHGHQQDSHFKSTSDHLLAMNGRAAGGMVISSILISNPHQTTYWL